MSQACVASCPVNTFRDDTPRPRSCVPCHGECVGGCSGSDATSCAACRRFSVGLECVSQCPAGTAANGARQCAACDSECLSNCTTPANPYFCGECKHVKDQGACVLTCPAARMRLYAGSCAADCPPAAPFFNDTRQAPQLPSLCVSDCRELNDPTRVYLSSTAPFRCTTQAAATADSPAAVSSSGSVDSWIIAVVVVVAIVLLVAAVVLVVTLRRRYSSAEVSAAPPDLYATPFPPSTPYGTITPAGTTRSTLDPPGSGYFDISTAVFDPSGSDPAARASVDLEHDHLESTRV
jgi:hypothetical protein